MNSSARGLREQVDTSRHGHTKATTWLEAKKYCSDSRTWEKPGSCHELTISTQPILFLVFVHALVFSVCSQLSSLASYPYVFTCSIFHFKSFVYFNPTVPFSCVSLLGIFLIVPTLCKGGRKSHHFTGTLRANKK